MIGFKTAIRVDLKAAKQLLDRLTPDERESAERLGREFSQILDEVAEVYEDELPEDWMRRCLENGRFLSRDKELLETPEAVREALDRDKEVYFYANSGLSCDFIETLTGRMVT